MTALVVQTLLLVLGSYILGCIAGCMARRALPAPPGGGPPTALEADGEPAPLSGAALDKGPVPSRRDG